MKWNHFSCTGFHIRHFEYVYHHHFENMILLIHSDANTRINMKMNAVFRTKECDNCVTVYSCAMCIRLCGITMRQWCWEMEFSVDNCGTCWVGIFFIAYAHFSPTSSHKVMQHIMLFHCSRRMFCFVFCLTTHKEKKKKSVLFLTHVTQISAFIINM